MSQTTVIETLVVRLKAEADSLTKGVKAAVAATQADMNKLAESLSSGAGRANKAFKEAIKLVESVRTPIRHYRDVVDELEKVHKAGAISHEQFNLAMLEAKKILPSYRAQLEAAAEATKNQEKAAAAAAKEAKNLADWYSRLRTNSAQLEQQLNLHALEKEKKDLAAAAAEAKKLSDWYSQLRTNSAQLEQQLNLHALEKEKKDLAAAAAEAKKLSDWYEKLKVNSAQLEQQLNLDALEKEKKDLAAAAAEAKKLADWYSRLRTNSAQLEQQLKQQAWAETAAASNKLADWYDKMRANSAKLEQQMKTEEAEVLRLARARREDAAAAKHLADHLAKVDRGQALMDQHRSRRQQYLSTTSELQSLRAGGHIDAGTLHRGTDAARSSYYGPMLSGGLNAAAGAARLATRASGMAAAGATGIAGASLAEYAGFEDQITRAAAVAGGVSDDFRKRMMDNAKQIASTGIISANQLAKGYTTLMQAGLEAEHALQALNIGQRFATASAMDLDHALEMLIKTQTVFGMRKTDPIANAQEMKRASDIMAKAANISVASAEDFSRAFTTKVGAAARVLRKDMAEIGGLLVVMANQGVTKELAGEQSAQMLRDLQASAIKAKDVWRNLGIAVFDAGGNMRHVADIIGDLERATAGASDEQRKEILRMLKFQERSVAATYNLLGLSSAIRNADRELRSLNNETDKLAKTIESSLLSQLKIMWNNIRNVGIELGTKLAPYAKVAVEYITQLAKSFAEFIRVDDAAAAAKRFAEEFKKLSGFLGGAMGELSAWAGQTLIPQLTVIAHDAGAEFAKSFWESFTGSGTDWKAKLSILEDSKAKLVSGGRGTGHDARRYDAFMREYEDGIAEARAKLGIGGASLQDRLGNLFTATYAPGKAVAKPSARPAVSGFTTARVATAASRPGASTLGRAAADAEMASEGHLPEASVAALAANTPAAIAAEKAHTRAAKYVESLKERIQELIHTEGMNERQVVIWKMQQELLNASLDKGEKSVLKQAIAEAKAADVRLIALEKEEKAAKKAAEDHDRLVAKASELVDRHESPFKKYAKEKKELDSMLKGGLIDQKTFDAELVNIKQKLNGPHKMNVSMNMLSQAMPGMASFDEMFMRLGPDTRTFEQRQNALRADRSARRAGYNAVAHPKPPVVPFVAPPRGRTPEEEAAAWRFRQQQQREAFAASAAQSGNPNAVRWSAASGNLSSSANEGARLLQQNNSLLEQNTAALRSSQSVVMRPAGF